MNSTKSGLDDLLTVASAAELLQVHPKTLYRLIAARQVPFIRKAGVGYRFLRSQLMEWLQQGYEPPTGWQNRI